MKVQVELDMDTVDEIVADALRKAFSNETYLAHYGDKDSKKMAKAIKKVHNYFTTRDKWI